MRGARPCSLGGSWGAGGAVCLSAGATAEQAGKVNRGTRSGAKRTGIGASGRWDHKGFLAHSRSGVGRTSGRWRPSLSCISAHFPKTWEKRFGFVMGHFFYCIFLGHVAFGSRIRDLEITRIPVCTFVPRRDLNYHGTEKLVFRGACEILVTSGNLSVRS